MRAISKMDLDSLSYGMIVFLISVLAFLIPITNSGIEITFFLLLAAVLFRVSLVPVTRRDLAGLARDRVCLALIVFYLLVGFSMTAAGPGLLKSLRAWICKWGEGVLIFCFVRVFLKKRHLKYVLGALMVSAFVVAVDGLVQKATGTDVIRGFAMNRTGTFLAVRATFNHYNNFATFLAVTFFICLGILLRTGKRYLSAALFALEALVLVNLFFTYSRGAWVALIAGCVFLMLFASGRKVKSAAACGLLLFAAGIFLVPALRERFLFMLQKGGDEGRFELWRNGMDIFMEAPLTGCGVGLFMEKMGEHSRMGYQYAHNCYLQVLAETGIFGFAAFMWFIAELSIRGLRSLRMRFDMVSMGVYAGFLAFLVHMFFDTQLYALKLSAFFWLMAALVMVSSGTDEGVQPVKGAA